MLDPLPIDPFIPEIVDRLRRSRALIVTAQPGAGKTTRVPPALVEDGPLIILQPRRVAARAIAQRIATERSWRVGDEIGWQIRLERRFGPDTKLLVATEGVLTARLQQDPLLSSFRTIVLDEFHERSIHADLAIALAKQAWLARDDLRIVIMSATLDSEAVSAFLNDCPVVDVPGRLYPVDIGYAPGMTVADAVTDVMRTSGGDVLCFLPGALEIRRAIDALEARGVTGEAEILPLHGSLESDAQDLALRPADARPALRRRRVIVATNIAETSVTVPGVTAVVDSGLYKVARYDADRGIDSLEVERITADAADQRAGRAARTGPGIVRRLWDARDRLRPHREPEIFRIDLSGMMLDVIAWGGDPRRFDWFERPAPEAIDAALSLLTRLDAIRNSALTETGRVMQRLPLHPRLARMLIAANGARQMAQACALLSERHLLPPRTATTTSDLLSALDRWSDVPPHVQRIAREIEGLAGPDVASGFRRTSLSEREFLRAVLDGYPDRVAQRRDPQSPKLRLASGAGAVVAPQSGVTAGEFLVALDVHAASRPDDPDARVRLASLVEREWLRPTDVDVVHRFDEARGVVRAVEVDRYDALILTERIVDADPQKRAEILADAWGRRGPRSGDVQLLRRLRFAGITVDAAAIARRAADVARSLDDIDLEAALTFEERQLVDRNAPASIQVPSGRTTRLEYEEDGTVSASVKLQELFGLADTPKIGPRKEPVRLALLAPNGRPVQTTRDLRSFWNTTYAEVRKELRGRYPKHPWPDDPWTATPTARTQRKS